LGDLIKTGDRITQGMVFYGNRSVYYNKPCYGIIITARCDLAQSKVKNVHYLTTIPINDWIKKDCLMIITEEIKKSSKKSIHQWMVDKELNGGLLEILGSTKVRIILNEYEKNSTKKNQIERSIETWELCERIRKNELSEGEIVPLLNENNAFEKKIREKMKLLINNQLNGFYFIPGEEMGEGREGFVINLRDINQVDIFSFNKMVEGKIDCITLEENERKFLNQFFYLENSEDFALPITVVDSPRIEHILQHFSQLFCRIGLEDLSEDYIKEILNFSVGI
jgi:hypothetical protein